MNPQLFFSTLKDVTDSLTSLVCRFTPSSILVAQEAIRKNVSSREMVSQFGFDPLFHFDITLSVNPSERRIRLNLRPLTIIGLDLLITSGIQIDESLQRSIRKYQDQQLSQEIVSHQRREADFTERGIRLNASQEQESPVQGRMEEQVLAKEDCGGDVLPVVDSGHAGVLRQDVVGSGEDANSSSFRSSGSGIVDGVFHPSERPADCGSLEVQGSGRQQLRKVD